MTAADEHFLAGLAHHKAGRLDAAERCYRAALQADPQHFAGLQHLGALAAGRGDHAEAVVLFQQAAAVKPSDPVIFFQLAGSLADLGRHDAALAAYDAALALKSDIPRLHAGRGAMLHALKRYDEAVVAYDAALALRANDALTHANRAAALQLGGRTAEALAAIEKSLQLQPADPKSLVIRALARFDRGEVEAAIADFETALRLQPDDIDTARQFGVLLLKCGGAVRAIELYSEILRRAPDDVEAYIGRAAARYQLSRHGEAVTDCDAALARAPESVVARTTRANALAGLGRNDEALADIDAALELEPGSAKALATRFSLLASACDFSRRTAAAADLVEAARNNEPINPFLLLFAADDPLLHRKAARLMSGPALGAAPTPAERDRLRIGYLSADLRDHVVAYQLVEVLERHDRTQFEIIAISLSPSDGTPFRARLMKAFDRFVESGDCSDADLTRLIARLDLDVVVDITGHTFRGRPWVLNARPAPVAVNYLGYPGTIGADYVDYIIADGVVIPPADDDFYDEAVARLPYPFMPRDTTSAAGPTPSRAEAGLPPTGLVFGGFAGAYKLEAELFDVWMRLLASVPDSVLWLNIADPAVRANLRRQAAERGMAPERLVFADRTAGRADYLARLKLIDVFLDTRCYGAHATASDLLWMGVPMVTVTGRSFATRVGASLLHGAGLDDLIARDLPTYEKIARALAEDPDRRAAIRATLEKTRDHLFEMTAYTRALEAAYRTMIAQRRAGTRSSFTVRS
jgi:protein O-GlcNAc transferase